MTHVNDAPPTLIAYWFLSDIDNYFYFFQYFYFVFSFFFSPGSFTCRMTRKTWKSSVTSPETHPATFSAATFSKPPKRCVYCRSNIHPECIHLAVSWYSVTKIRQRMRMPFSRGKWERNERIRVEFETFSWIPMETGHTHTPFLVFYIFHSSGYQKASGQQEG